MKWRHWAILIVLALINYIIFSTAFTKLAAQRQPQPRPTRTPQPTFEIVETRLVSWIVVPTSTQRPTWTPVTASPLPLLTATAASTATAEGATTDAPPPATETPPPATAPPPTDTPQPQPSPTPKPKPTKQPTPKPTKKPPPTPTTAVPQFTAELVWDPLVAPNCSGPAIAKQSMIRDRAGNPLNGVRVEVNCYDNVWLSHPSGTPGEYEPGHYDFAFGQSVPQDWTCTARVFDINGQPVVSSDVARIRFDTNDCRPHGPGHQVAILNWIKNW